mgnify:CR=1 FL=1
MAFTPISNTVPQYEENGVAASGYFIKFYESGTTTPTAMATDSTGTTLLDKCELNTEGYPINGSGAVFIPHINVEYKIALFRNAADTDANDLNNAAWDVDGLFPYFTDSSIGTDFNQTPLNTDIVYPVANVTELRALTGISVGQKFHLDGHTIQGVGGDPLTATKLHTTEVDNNGSLFVVDGVVIERANKGYLLASDFGAVDAEDNTIAMQACIDNSDSAILDVDSVFTQLIPRSNTTLTINSVLTSASEVPLSLASLEKTQIVFTSKGKLLGGGSSETQNGMTLTDCNSVKIYNADIDLCLNKGIGIGGTSTDCLIESPKVRGATGATGAGVSIFGADAVRNSINNADCSENRIGVTINGAHYNNVNHPTANACTSSGVSIDGIISGSGDGGKYNKINHPVCNNGTDATKGGVFCGNGSDYNEIIHPICNNNAGAGVRFAGGAGNPNKSNSIIDAVCNNNSSSGMSLSWCPNMNVINPTCEGNGGRGISSANSDGIRTSGGFIDGNTLDGILIQGPRSIEDGVTVTNNGGDGIEIAFGGTLAPSDNLTMNCHIEGNGGLDYKSAGTAKAYNLTGFVTDNKGKDIKSDGQIIGHGLSDTPNFVNATGSVAGDIITVTSISTTTFTVSVKDTAGSPGSSQLIYWEASLY